MTTTYNDIGMLNGEQVAPDKFAYYKAMQRQINSGVVWQMEGSMGRAAMDAIRSGHCMCAHVGGRDYYGNRIPARTDLQPGTFGTVGFVQKQMGKHWAKMIAKEA